MFVCFVDNFAATTDPTDTGFIAKDYQSVMFCCDSKKFFVFEVTAWYNGLRTHSRDSQVIEYIFPRIYARMYYEHPRAHTLCLSHQGTYCMDSFPATFPEDNGACQHWPALSEMQRLGICGRNVSFRDIRIPQHCPNLAATPCKNKRQRKRQRPANAEGADCGSGDGGGEDGGGSGENGED